MRTILVIDDEHPTLEMFRLHLEAYGHRVLTADSGEEGLAVFEAADPQIVFTDLKMPGMDGLAAHFAGVLDRLGLDAVAPRFACREQALAHLRAAPDRAGPVRASAPCLDRSRA